MPSERRLRQLTGTTHKHGVAIKAKIAELLRISKGLERLNAGRRRELRELEAKRRPGKTIVMYDTITLETVPPNPEAVAGYVDGKWPTYSELVKRYPKAQHLSIAVFPRNDAQCLDVEPGDATPEQAPAWVRRQHKRGIKRPVVYTSISAMPHLLSILARAGIPRTQVRVWTAHYSFKPHLCSAKCGYGFTGTADATQWTDKALGGRNLDESLCSGSFFS